jgi:hypothetical protein
VTRQPRIPACFRTRRRARDFACRMRAFSRRNSASSTCAAASALGSVVGKETISPQPVKVLQPHSPRPSLISRKCIRHWHPGHCISPRGPGMGQRGQLAWLSSAHRRTHRSQRLSRAMRSSIATVFVVAAPTCPFLAFLCAGVSCCCYSPFLDVFGRPSPRRNRFSLPFPSPRPG